jgi:hypothetical protein
MSDHPEEKRRWKFSESQLLTEDNTNGGKKQENLHNYKIHNLYSPTILLMRSNQGVREGRGKKTTDT